MPQIKADLADDQSSNDARRQGPMHDRLSEAPWNRKMGAPRQWHEKQGHEQAWDQAAENKVAQIREDCLAKDLLRPPCEQPLQWDEHRRGSISQMPSLISVRAAGGKFCCASRSASI